MKTAGIMIDPWKLKIFKKHLDKSSFNYTVCEGKDITTIVVEMASMKEAGEVAKYVKAANNEARNSKLN